MLKNRAVGSILLIAGTTVGAGILALPVISKQTGLLCALVTLCVLWAFMLFSALVLLDVTLQCAPGTSFSTLAAKTIGRPGQIAMNISIISLFYCLAVAYIRGGSAALTTGLEQYVPLHLPQWVSACIFTFCLGGLVTWHVYAVDLSNRILLTIKMIAFFMVLFLLIPHVDYRALPWQPQPHTSSQTVAMMIPVFFTAFGFHGSIPSIVQYVGPDRKQLRRIFIIGSSIPLLLYVVWETVMLSILPSHFAAHRSIQAGIHLFTDIAMTTSFLGVTLGLFDFFSDMLHIPGRGKHRFRNRVQIGLLTFVPPLFFSILSPHGFIAALGYAALPLALLAVILPACMAWRRPSSGSKGLCVLFLFGCSVFLLQILVLFKYSPGT